MTARPDLQASPLRAGTSALAVSAALLADVLLIVVFAAIGRSTHDEAGALLGPLQTAWPFLAGMALGWLVGYLAWRRAPTAVRDGIPVWLGAVIGGMALRTLTGQGTAWPFVIVATLTLAALLLGWRLLLAIVRRRRASAERRG